MVNYELGKIYKIESYQTTDIYIGSTCEKYLSNRFGGHKNAYKLWENGKMNNITSFKILQYDDAFITLIEEYPCKSKYELEAREGYWIRQLDCVNRITPGRTPLEYKRSEKYKSYDKKYRQNHLLEKQKYDKEYRDRNNTAISERRKVKHRCEICNVQIRKQHRLRHNRSLEHQQYELIIDWKEPELRPIKLYDISSDINIMINLS